MTDIATINFTGEYSGLLSSLYVTAGLGSLCLIGFEVLRHVPRRRGEQGAKPPKNHSSQVSFPGNIGERDDIITSR
jgi:hypothetical protein